MLLEALTASPALAAVLALLATSLALWKPRVSHSEEAQAFLDHLPFLRQHTAFWAFERFGPSRARRRPGLLERFDWYLYNQLPGSSQDHHGPTSLRSRDPHTVVTSPASWDALVDAAAKELDGSRADRVLVFAGMPERFLSEVLGNDPAVRKREIRRLRRFFSRILYEYKDVDEAEILTLPSGLNELYLRPGVLEAAQAAIAAARLDSAAKPHGVLAVPTIYWMLTAMNEPSRVQAREWAASRAARDAGVELRYIDPRAWYRELAAYQFLLSPTGTGIQNAKTIEALFVLTVPIVQHCIAHKDMVHMGFPLVLVDHWPEITSSNLSSWWRSLSPRLASFRYHCLTADAYWRLIVGDISYCK